MSTYAETLDEARKWDARKARYLAEGLCHRCAAQLAYSRNASLCSECLVITAEKNRFTLDPVPTLGRPVK
jgi:predicted amidophosphoribosyltransferase